eukprot:CAMPEP_0202895014 /NCGR_PEP_ID=MMETSP1392-20130828/4294_1 /ASSEMBLY_ACC=CAM_ASM_000868 /TAXON_ID=225041 /ORGANISM="Chlamydomonas chlamydogama, Strain SAG 11-48b" /LENGTH=156 /DNA_ID=CAMNT_0049579881 /DNA_START=170 /DNA_END=637 /DNA_ORIENTATION=+
MALRARRHGKAPFRARTWSSSVALLAVLASATQCALALAVLPPDGILPSKENGPDSMQPRRILIKRQAIAPLPRQNTAKHLTVQDADADAALQPHSGGRLHEMAAAILEGGLHRQRSLLWGYGRGSGSGSFTYRGPYLTKTVTWRVNTGNGGGGGG